MHIHVSPKNGVPIYLQIVNQIKYLAASGQLRLGEEILPIRVLAEQLLINPNSGGAGVSRVGDGGRAHQASRGGHVHFVRRFAALGGGKSENTARTRGGFGGGSAATQRADFGSRRAYRGM